MSKHPKSKPTPNVRTLVSQRIQSKHGQHCVTRGNSVALALLSAIN